MDLNINIYKIEGPTLVKVNKMAENNTMPTEPNADRATLTSNERNEKALFTCYICDEKGRTFNTQITIPPFTINIEIWNELETRLITSLPQKVPSEAIKNNRSFDFILNFSPNLSNQKVVVFARVSQKTIMQEFKDVKCVVDLYDDRAVDLVYWSKSEQAGDLGKEVQKIQEAHCNDFVYLHIKTRGMGNQENISVVLRDENENAAGYDAQNTVYPMTQNRGAKQVVVREIIRWYKKNYQIAEDSQLPATIKLKAIVNLPEGGDRRIVPLTIHTPPQEEQANKTTPTGTSMVQVKNGSTSNNDNEDDEKKYTNFIIGYMCHIGGTGSTATSASGSHPGQVTVYPFDVYKIELKDLVDAKLINEIQALYLTTKNHDNKTKVSKADLEKNFNKISAEIASGKTLISIFKTANGRANDTAIKQLMDHITSINKATVNGSEIPTTICRDAWQIGNDYPRETDRYGSNQECPPGSYFINFISWSGKYEQKQKKNKDGTIKKDKDGKVEYEDNTSRPIPHYRIGVSDLPEGRTIYANATDKPDKRTSISIHNGTGFASVGCLTFNLPWTSHGNSALITTLYGVSKTEYKKDKNKKRLNFICIETRNAQIIDAKKDHRYEDLTNPQGKVLEKK